MFNSLLLKNLKRKTSDCKIRMLNNRDVTINNFIFNIEEINKVLNDLNNYDNSLIFNQNLRKTLIRYNVVKSVPIFAFDECLTTNMPQHSDLYCVKSLNFTSFFTMLLSVQSNPKLKSESFVKLEKV